MYLIYFKNHTRGCLPTESDRARPRPALSNNFPGAPVLGFYVYLAALKKFSFSIWNIPRSLPLPDYPVCMN
jgi:hypothetical protein